MYGAQTSAPITADIQAQAAEMSGLFPEPKQNIYDLASAVGAGLVGAASDPRGLGAGLLLAFNHLMKEQRKYKKKML